MLDTLPPLIRRTEISTTNKKKVVGKWKHDGFLDRQGPTNNFPGKIQPSILNFFLQVITKIITNQHSYKFSSTIPNVLFHLYNTIAT